MPVGLDAYPAGLAGNKWMVKMLHLIGTAELDSAIEALDRWEAAYERLKAEVAELDRLMRELTAKREAPRHE